MKSWICLCGVTENISDFESLDLGSNPGRGTSKTIFTQRSSNRQDRRL